MKGLLPINFKSSREITVLNFFNVIYCRWKSTISRNSVPIAKLVSILAWDENKSTYTTKIIIDVNQLEKVQRTYLDSFKIWNGTDEKVVDSRISTARSALNNPKKILENYGAYGCE